MMTIGSQPELLVLGYLRNQGLFTKLEEIESVIVDWEHEVAEVTTRNKTQTGHFSGNHQPIIELAKGKIRGQPLDSFPLRQSDIYRILESVKSLNNTYRKAGSVHGCGLFLGSKQLAFIEDVGRHGATDALAGKMWLEGITGKNKIFYTTGRLTSEIVIKSALMGIPILISRNGTTQMAIAIAKELGVALIARAKSRHFIAFNAPQLIFDTKGH